MSGLAACVVTHTRWVIIRECWFGPSASDAIADVQLMRQWPAGDWKGNATPKHTLLIQLNMPTEQIQATFKKDAQYEIRRAQTKDGLVFELMQSPGPSELNQFSDFFDGFALQKSLSPVDRSYLQAAADAGCLKLTCVKRGEQVLVWHSYILVGERVRLLHSASQFREHQAEAGFRSLVGRANRWLHWQDMQAFASHGVASYDFGGWYAGCEDKEKLRINAFKEEFGGKPIQEFEGQIALTLKGKLYLWLRGLRSKGG
ncbi:GNAT family protein [Roseateles albus]|uniref:BioF2-like acetyltransferase domain-containing protein n=1 Tax=Roseateles albus TaxID=2987525 RepID=A0ABT5KDR6_9BURK|nr:hypothetical protein [Roseateles albus]MDC8772077.1 hypothetical protein [Roseateles albus]